MKPYALVDHAVCRRCILSLHIKSIFHINWLAYGVIDKLESKKGTELGGREISVSERAALCCHIVAFVFTRFDLYFDALANKDGEALHGNGGRLKAV